MKSTLIDWDAITAKLRENESRIENKILEVKAYVQNDLKQQHNGVNIGLVHTKLEQDIRNNCFMVWIEKSNGLYIDHKFMYFNEVGIAPIELIEV
ncbi:hypothetical protein D3C78_1415720 [compost metagenome]